MDFSLLSGAATAITIAKDVGRAAIGIRDANQLAAVISQMNEQLLKAQDALFSHNAQLLALQQDHFEACQKLRELEKTLLDRRRYALFEITQGSFVYRADAQPVPGEAGEPSVTEPVHYVCQRCFDGPQKSKVVLRYQPTSAYVAVPYWICPACDAKIYVR
ncbi:hypothetical protein BKK79_35905 [Cupriavidus sp. USMAA2-4]|uniref:hypothetical protein n=1 Tax=Cupriavidus sp. USMAA2-4 TaxID=876364 RepID=UPI0008A6BA2C|nr:hypothetical protein [Cupriavidus sp. USMAA2-4]AOY96880.1 hypothetical protein BKK79_35905 [Cupriavidus sp. USMAA2-4]